MMLWLRGAIFTALVPLIVAGAVPYWIDPDRTLSGGWWQLGGVAIAAGAVIYTMCLVFSL